MGTVILENSWWCLDRKRESSRVATYRYQLLPKRWVWRKQTKSAIFSDRNANKRFPIIAFNVLAVEGLQWFESLHCRYFWCSLAVWAWRLTALLSILLINDSLALLYLRPVRYEIGPQYSAFALAWESVSIRSYKYRAKPPFILARCYIV